MIGKIINDCQQYYVTPDGSKQTSNEVFLERKKEKSHLDLMRPLDALLICSKYKNKMSTIGISSFILSFLQ
jgi:hypothetical protein